MDNKTEAFIEGVHLQMEIMAVGLIAMSAKITALCEKTGLDQDSVKLESGDLEKTTLLWKSITNRIVKTAKLSAAAEGVEIDEEVLKKNAVGVLQEALTTRGDSLKDSATTAVTLFKGAVVASEDAPEEPPTIPYPLLPANEHTTDADADAAVEDVENDLLAVFRSSRQRKVTDPYLEIEDGTLRANFYNPETLPETPEEYMNYDAQALEYFVNLTEKTKRSGMLDDFTAKQVLNVLSGADEFQQDKVMTPEGNITQKVISQGHDQAYFEISVGSTVEAAETLIAAYSVSVARLRGAYIQSKLKELHEYSQTLD